MRTSRNIFESENYRGTGIKTVSGVTAVTMAFSAISFIAAVFIIANFRTITAQIAIWMANLLSSGFPILITVIVIIYFWTKLKRSIHRSLW